MMVSFAVACLFACRNFSSIVAGARIKFLMFFDLHMSQGLCIRLYSNHRDHNRRHVCYDNWTYRPVPPVLTGLLLRPSSWQEHREQATRHDDDDLSTRMTPKPDISYRCCCCLLSPCCLLMVIVVVCRDNMIGLILLLFLFVNSLLMVPVRWMMMPTLCEWGILASVWYRLNCTELSMIMLQHFASRCVFDSDSQSISSSLELGS